MLEEPKHPDELYVARGDEVLLERPFMTGDVFGWGEPDADGEPAECLGMVVTHPCSIRSDGVNLVDSVHVARVETSEPQNWKYCKRDRMPLPALQPDKFHVVRFDDIGMVSSSRLPQIDRLACLSVRGVNLLQQRLVWYLTRFVVPTGKLNELYTPVVEEIELQQEWSEVATDHGVPLDEAVEQFHEWIRSDDETGTMRQQRLRDPQARSSVRRELRAAARRLYHD